MLEEYIQLDIRSLARTKPRDVRMRAMGAFKPHTAYASVDNGEIFTISLGDWDENQLRRLNNNRIGLSVSGGMVVLAISRHWKEDGRVNGDERESLMMPD